MVLGGAHVEFRMAGIAVIAVGVGGLPLVVTEMRLRERDEHPYVVRGPQNLGKAQVRARIAAVVVGVDKVDADALETLEALAGGVVGGERRAHAGIIHRQGTKEDARAVEVEVPAVDPQLAEPEPDRSR